MTTIASLNPPSTVSQVRKKARPIWEKILVWGSRLHVLLIMAGFIALPFVLIPWMRQPFTGAFFESTLVIAHVRAPHYLPHETTRFHTNFVVTAFNGRQIHTAGEMNALLRKHHVGEIAALEEMGYKAYHPQPVRVRLRPFSLKERWLYFLIPYILGIIFVITGIWAFTLRRRDIVGRTLAIFSTAMGFVIAGLLDVWATQTLTPLWLYAVGIAGASLGTLALIFPRRTLETKHSLWLYLIALLLTGYTIFEMSNLRNPWAYIHARQWLMGFTALDALAFMVALGYWQSKREFPLVRMRARLLLGAFLLSLGPIIAWVFSYIFFSNAIHFTPLVFVTLPILPFGLAYAVGTYRTVEIDVIARRTAAYLLLGAIIAGGYGLVVAGLSLILGRFVPPRSPYLLGLAAFTIALIFNPLYNRLLTIVNATFAKSRQAYLKYLEGYSRRLVGLVEQNAVVALTRALLREALRTETIHIFLYNELTGYYRAEPDESGVPTADLTFTEESPLIKFLQKINKAFFFSIDDVPPALVDEQPKLVLLRSVIFIPLPGGQRLQGFIALGEREGRYGAAEVEFLDSLAHQLALAIERVSTVNKLRQQVDRMNALTRLAQGANVTIELDDVLELIYAQTSRLIPCYYFQILLTEGDEEILRRVFVVEGDERKHEAEGKIVSPNEGLAWEVARRRRIIRVRDYPLTCRFEGKTVDLPNATGWMGVPLVAGADVVGVMVLAHNTFDTAFADEQAEWAQSVADLAGGVIAKARLLEESRRRAIQLSNLNRIASRLSSTLSLGELRNHIALNAASLLDAEGAVLFSVDELSGDLKFEVVVGPNSDKLVGKPLPADDNLVRDSIENRRPITLVGTEDYPRWVQELLGEGEEPRSLLIVPLVTKDKVLGAIAVVNKRGGLNFTKEDEQLALAFAAQATAALENAQLYAMTDQALAEKVEELSALQRIDRELNSTLDLTRAMQVTLEWAVRRTNSSAGIIGLMENEAGLKVVAAYGYPEEKSQRLKDKALSLEDIPAAQQAIQSRRPIVLNSSETPTSSPLGESSNSLLLMPIEREGKVTGLLILESTNERAYSQEMLYFLTRLIDHASIAIANAQLYNEAQRANQTKSEFISFVAHELKTPMTSIRGYTDLLAKGMVGDLNENQKNFLNTIRNNVERMRRLVEDLLEISRLEAGKLKLNLERVDLHEVVNEVIETFRGQIEAKKQTLYTDIPDDLPMLWADKMRLSQILVNLVSNAHKYTPEGGRIEIIARAKEEWRGEGGARVVHIMVRDNGLGMSEEDQRKVFQKFFRSEDERARQAPGTGLGLHLTKYLVEMHGGRIWFESQLGVGTTFHFTIPVAED